MPGYEYAKIVLLSPDRKTNPSLRALRLTPNGSEAVPGGTKPSRHYSADKLQDDPMPYVRELLQVMPGWQPCGTSGLIVRDSPSHAIDYTTVIREPRFDGLLKRNVLTKYSLARLTQTGPDVLDIIDWAESDSYTQSEMIRRFEGRLGPGWSHVEEMLDVYFWRSAGSAQPSTAIDKRQAATPAGRGDPVQALRSLAVLKEEGLITEEEYAAKRAEILATL